MNRKYVTTLGCILMALFAMNLTIISPLIMEIGKTFSLSITQSGLIFTFNFIGFVVFILIGGALADRFGKKPVLNVAIIGATISILGFAAVQNFTVMCAAAILMGGFGGVLESIVSALISDINPENPGYYVNLTQVFFGIGAIVGPVTAGFAISNGVNWRVCYLVLGALYIIMSVIFLPAKVQVVNSAVTSGKSLKVSNKENNGNAVSLRGNIQPWRATSLVKNPVFILLCLGMLFYTGAEVGGWGWMCKLLEENLGYSVGTSGFAVAFFWISMTVGRILCGALTKKVPLVWIIRVLALSSAVFTLLSAFVKSEAGMWILVALMGLSYSSQFPLIMAYGGSRVKAPSGIAFSLLVAGGGVGSMTVPYIMGLVGDNFNMATAMLVPTVLLFLLTAIFFSFGKNQEAACIPESK